MIVMRAFGIRLTANSSLEHFASLIVSCLECAERASQGPSDLGLARGLPGTLHFSPSVRLFVNLGLSLPQAFLLCFRYTATATRKSYPSTHAWSLKYVYSKEYMSQVHHAFSGNRSDMSSGRLLFT